MQLGIPRRFVKKKKKTADSNEQKVGAKLFKDAKNIYDLRSSTFDRIYDEVLLLYYHSPTSF